MFGRSGGSLRRWLVLAGWLGLSTLTGLAGQPEVVNVQVIPYCQPGTAPRVISPVVPGSPAIPGSPVAPTMPGANGSVTPSTPSTPATPGTTGDITGTQPGAMTPGAADLGAPEAGDGVALGGGAVDGGAYLDSAIPRTQLRLRFDAAYYNNRPDRAEFFYSKCGCNPGAPGPFGIEKSVDYQDVRTYLEIAPSERFSVFGEIPYRMLDPEVNPNEQGLSNCEAGFKYAVIAEEDRFLTFQFRWYFPIGRSHEGLGFKHQAVEPAILYYQRLSERLHLQAEFRDWTPFAGTDFEGSVLRYGLGLTWVAMQSCRARVGVVGEMVGWTVLDGKQTVIPGSNNDPTLAVTQDAEGDTIVNGKLGLRFGLGDGTQSGLMNQSDFFVGYSRALTGEVWYKDAIRVEMRLRY